MSENGFEKLYLHSPFSSTQFNLAGRALQDFSFSFPPYHPRDFRNGKRDQDGVKEKLGEHHDCWIANGDESKICLSFYVKTTATIPKVF